MPSSPPSASQLLGLSSPSPAAAETPPPIPHHPGSFRGQPTTTTLPMNLSLSPPPDDNGIDEPTLLARLGQKRREIEAEIEAFRAAKEDEFREFERKLREEQKAQYYKKRKRENGQAYGGGGGEGKVTTHAAAGGATSSSDDAAAATGKGHGEEEEVEEEQEEEEGVVGSINYGAQIPLDLGGSKLDDTLKSELSDYRKQSRFDRSSVSSVSSSGTTTSPPFERELQAAGLFTPRYLPLLDNNYFRQTSPPTSPPLPQDHPSIEASPQQQAIPNMSSSRTGNTSPTYPLASSLKSSSSSSSTLSKSGNTKQKSPKRVTFHFDDENSVPSRSSPPTAKVLWTLGGDHYEDEEGFVDEGEEVEEAGGEINEREKAEHVEDITATEVPVMARFPGDELVVPSNIGGGTVQQSDDFDGLGISVPHTNGTNGNKAGSDSDSDNDEPNGYDDDDEALFDLDETIPEAANSSPPQRDYGALTDTPQAETNARLTASSFPMLPSFTPSMPPVLASATEAILTFGKSPGPRAGLPRVRRGSLGGVGSPLANKPQLQPEPIASSLPNIYAESLKTGFVPTPGGRFRRRSIVKYDLSEDETAFLKGKGKENKQAISEDSDEEDETLLSRSPNAKSLPMSISRLSPGAFAVSSSRRNPTKPPSKPIIVNNDDSPDPAPVTGRPSPKPRSPLGAAVQFPIQSTAQATVQATVPKIDSADLLASMPTSFMTVSDASPQKNDSVSSYRRSSPFPSAYDHTPYRTAYAAEVAAAAALNDQADYGGAMESVVGGVDGRTGLDPGASSIAVLSSFSQGAGSKGRSGSFMEAMMDPARMSLGMRMAWESGKKEGRR